MPPREAASLVYSTDALKHRAIKAGLSQEEVEAIVNNNVKSLAQLAFAISPPGTAPSDDAIKEFFAGQVGVTLATITSLKLLIFEAHTLVVANIKNEITKKDDVSTQSFLPAAERDRRIQEQQGRLQGLRLRGDEECAYANYDLVFSMMERDCLTYHPPEKFVTRRFELLQKKPGKEITLEHNSLTVKEKQGDYTCSTRTELELFQAMRRRALTFDLVGLCRYEVFNSYHSELLQHLQEEPPPGYNHTSLIQVLRADRAAFLLIAEQITSLKRNASGELPLEKYLPNILSKPSVSFHLPPSGDEHSEQAGSSEGKFQQTKARREPKSCTCPKPCSWREGQRKRKAQRKETRTRSERSQGAHRQIIGEPKRSAHMLALQHEFRVQRRQPWRTMQSWTPYLCRAWLSQAAWATTTLMTAT